MDGPGHGCFGIGQRATSDPTKEFQVALFLPRDEMPNEHGAASCE